jgi:LysM repeat protein
MILAPVAIAGALAVTVPASAVAPPEYTVHDGDTVSGIAERFGLKTADVLAFNGLERSSLIFPGQVLRLQAAPPVAAAPAPAPVVTPSATAEHVVVSGDTLYDIAQASGMGLQALLDLNQLTRQSVIHPGDIVKLSTLAPAAASAPVAVAAPAPSAPAPQAAASAHVVAAGDTLSAIAAGAGMGVQELLDLNGLGWDSIIYPGQSILLAKPEPTPRQVADAAASGHIAPLNTEMRANARLIISIGRSLGVSDKGIIIALTAAAQESILRNVDYGDRDSLGLFQQRPSMGWGTAEQVMDPTRATYAFFGGASNPNPGRTHGLLDVSGWESLPVAAAAQAVQVSAYPNAYAKWEASANVWLAELG